MTEPQDAAARLSRFDVLSASGQMLLRNWTAFIVSCYKLALLVSGLLTVALAIYAYNTLGISTNTEDMIDDNLEWRQNFIQLRNQFPRQYRAIAIVIDAQTEALAQAAVSDLDRRLAVNSERVTDRFSATVSEPLAGRELLLLSEDELLQITDDLAVAQPFFGKLRQQYSLAALFELLSLAYREDPSGIPAAFENRLISAMQPDNNRNYSQLDWSRLNTVDDTSARRILFVNVVLDNDKPRPARQVLKELREQGDATASAFDNQVRVRLSGTIALEDEELVTVYESSKSTTVFALVSVCLILLLAFRSLRLLLISIVTLLTGLVATAAFAAASVSKLNAISIAFAILYFGLAVDFIIHYLLRLREILAKGTDLTDALVETSGRVGGALFVCAVTTAAGFFAFTPTAFVGVSQLGLISGTGMFISFIFTLTMLPALIRLAFPANYYVNPEVENWKPGVVLSYVLKAPRLIIVVVLIAAVISIASLGQLRFEKDPMLLRDPKTESVQTFNDLSDDPNTALRSISIVADGDSDITGLTEKLTALPSVERVYSLASFDTGDATEQQYLLDETSLLLGADFASYPALEAVEPDVTGASVQRLLDELEKTGSGEELRGVLSELLAQLEQLDSIEQRETLERLQQALLGDLPGSMQLLKSRLEATPLPASEFSEDFQQRWVSAEGHQLIQVIPSNNIGIPENAEEFVTEVSGVSANATGVPVVFERSGDTVAKAFKVAFSTALLVISVLLFVLLRSLISVLLVLIPLLLSVLLLIGSMVFIGLPFNFANVIALPLLLGISVDTGIHLVHRARAHESEDLHRVLVSSTTRAIVFSSVTTLASFGNLALSDHVGSASMGYLLAIGLIINFLIMLLVLPAMMILKPK